MKTYAPKGLHGAMLRDLLAELACTPAQAAKFLRVTERSVFRWLSDDSAPFAVLAALWHETPHGRHTTALDVGNELAIHQGLARSNAQALSVESKRLAYVVRLGDFGSANDPIFCGPVRGSIDAVALVDGQHGHGDDLALNRHNYPKLPYPVAM